MSEDERSFIWGFRIAHCVKGIAAFVAGIGFCSWKIALAKTTAGRVISALAGVFMLYMAIMMTVWLVNRRRGRWKVVVGEKQLSAPSMEQPPAKPVEVAFAEVTNVEVTQGTKAALRVTHAGGHLDIERTMLGTDAEFAELAALVKQRAPVAATAG